MKYTGAYRDLVKGMFLTNCILANNYNNEEISLKTLTTLKTLAEKTLEIETITKGDTSWQVQVNKQKPTEDISLGLFEADDHTRGQDLKCNIEDLIKVTGELKNIYKTPGQYKKAIESGTLLSLVDNMHDKLVNPIAVVSNTELADVLSYFIKSFLNNSDKALKDDVSKELLITPIGQIILFMYPEISGDIITQVKGKSEFVAKVKQLGVTTFNEELERIELAGNAEYETVKLLSELEDIGANKIKTSNIFK